MTIGEKIRESRKNAGFTQEQLAEKLTVSRQAVTKWESDKGIPDIENLKALSGLLNVSIDYLLDDGEDVDKTVIREPIDLSKYKKVTARLDVVTEHFPDAEIYPLIAKQRLTKHEKIIDNVLGFFTDAPFGVPALLNEMKDIDKTYYLIEKEGKQFFVKLTKEFMETTELAKPISGKRFDIGNQTFTRIKQRK